MTQITLPYHKSEIILSQAPDNCVLITPPTPSPLEQPAHTLESRLLTYDPLKSFKPLLGRMKIGIAINDDTRPIPYPLILPVVIKYLLQNGTRFDNIQLYIASGTHQPMSSDSVMSILNIPEFRSINICVHDCDNNDELTYLGKTSLGTDVWINKSYVNMDLRLVIGNIEPHHFMGYSGGAKTAAIGLAGRLTIEQNHSMLGQDHTTVCHYTDRKSVV